MFKKRSACRSLHVGVKMSASLTYGCVCVCLIVLLIGVAGEGTTAYIQHQLQIFKNKNTTKITHNFQIYVYTKQYAYTLHAKYDVMLVIHKTKAKILNKFGVRVCARLCL